MQNRNRRRNAMLVTYWALVALSLIAAAALALTAATDDRAPSPLTLSSGAALALLGVFVAAYVISIIVDRFTPHDHYGCSCEQCDINRRYGEIHHTRCGHATVAAAARCLGAAGLIITLPATIAAALWTPLATATAFYGSIAITITAWALWFFTRLPKDGQCRHHHNAAL